MSIKEFQLRNPTWNGSNELEVIRIIVWKLQVIPKALYDEFEYNYALNDGTVKPWIELIKWYLPCIKQIIVVYPISNTIDGNVNYFLDN